MVPPLSVFCFPSLLVLLWRPVSSTDTPSRFVVRLNGEQLGSPILCVPLHPQQDSDPGLMLVKSMRSVPSALDAIIESEDGGVLAKAEGVTPRPLADSDIRDCSPTVRTRIWVGLTSTFAKALGGQSVRLGNDIATALAVDDAHNFFRTDGRVYARVSNAWRGAQMQAKGSVLLCSAKQIAPAGDAAVFAEGSDVHLVFSLEPRLQRKEAVCWVGVENGLRFPIRIDLGERADSLPAVLASDVERRPALAAFLRQSGLL